MVRKVRAHDPNKITKPKPAPVEVRHIAHPKVWKTAIGLAQGNMSRITVISYACVTVLLP